MSAKVCASFPSSSVAILAAFTFETIVTMTDRSSSWGTAGLTRRFKARLLESEMSDGSETWLLPPRGGGDGGTLWHGGSPVTPPESISTGGATSSTRPFSSRKESGVGVRGRGSLGCLSYSDQPGNIRYSLRDSTDKSYIELTVSMW